MIASTTPARELSYSWLLYL